MSLLERGNRRELHTKPNGKRVWRIVSPSGRILDEYPVKARSPVPKMTRGAVRHRAESRRRKLRRW